MQLFRKRFTAHKPQKLPEFAYKPAGWDSQDGADQAAPPEPYTDLPDDIQDTQHSTGTNPDKHQAPECDPLPSSPAKARMRLDTPPLHTQRQQIEAQAPIPFSIDQALHSSMASFPTSGQPVMDTTLKDMLLSLQSSLMNDLSSMFHRVTSDIHKLDDRMTNAERGIQACTSTVNEVIDSYDTVKEEQAWMRAKMADLEDRSRRNNIKLRGVPESILPVDLPRYAKELIHLVIPEASPRDAIIDRIHRIAKPSHLAASVPRDVLMRVHFYQTKEKLLMGLELNHHYLPPILGYNFSLTCPSTPSNCDVN